MSTIEIINKSYRPRNLALLSLICASIALAYALVLPQMLPANSLVVTDDKVGLDCDVDDSNSNSQVQMDENFYSTSWLPSRGEFGMVSNNQPEETMWNPLGKSWLSSEQLALLGMAYSIGSQDGSKTHASLVQAVLLQESNAGRLDRLGHLSAPLGKRSYGVMQVKVAAARDVLRHRPELGHFGTDEQLITRLITDDEFNIRIASAYLKYLRRYMGSDPLALVAYNIGLNAARRVMDADEFKYVQNVERYLDLVVQRYNVKFSGEESPKTASM